MTPPGILGNLTLRRVVEQSRCVDMEIDIRLKSLKFEFNDWSPVTWSTAIESSGSAASMIVSP